MPEEVSPAEAAEMLGVTTKTLRGYADRGLVAVRKLPSGRRRFRRADIEDLLKYVEPETGGAA